MRTPRQIRDQALSAPLGPVTRLLLREDLLGRFRGTPVPPESPSQAPRTSALRVLPVLPRRDCSLCDLAKRAGSVNIRLCALHYNPAAPFVLLVVGQNPGHEEDREGRPFVGISGRILKRSYLGGISAYDHSSVYLTNAARCHHGADDPTSGEYKTCTLSHLPREIRYLHHLHPDKPMVMLCLGGASATATHRLFHDSKPLPLKDFFKNQGMPAEFDGRVWRRFFAYHPALVARDNNRIKAVNWQMVALKNHFESLVPSVSVPNIVAPKPPE